MSTREERLAKVREERAEREQERAAARAERLAKVRANGGQTGVVVGGRPQQPMAQQPQAAPVAVEVAKPSPDVGACAACGATCNADGYCWGCKEHICDDCDKSAGALAGSHKWEAHLREPWEEDAADDEG